MTQMPATTTHADIAPAKGTAKLDLDLLNDTRFIQSNDRISVLFESERMEPDRANYTIRTCLTEALYLMSEQALLVQ